MVDGTARRTAVVIGGGIGGVAAAVALHRGGWRVLVLERAAEFGEVGAGVTLMANALRALDALGLGATVTAAGQVEAPGGARTSTGRWLSRVDGAAMARQLGTGALGIHRATLHRILREALPPRALVPGAEVVDVDPGGSRESAVVGYVRDGQRDVARADLVVAADGLNSPTRARLWPAAPPPAYSGSTAWRSVTSKRWDGELVVAVSWGPGAEFGMVPLGDGRVYWYGAVNAPPGQRSADEMAEVRRRFGSWHDPIPALLDATDPRAVLRHDIYELAAPLPSYVRARVALLGDAAHAMTPNLGQGAAQALEDAVVLGAVCAGTSGAAGIPAALLAYDVQRRSRTQAVARASRWAGRLGQRLTNPVGVAARNATMRLTPPRVALRSMTRFADWRPPEAGLRRSSPQ